jgi:hypothetical protein
MIMVVCSKVYVLRCAGRPRRLVVKELAKGWSVRLSFHFTFGMFARVLVIYVETSHPLIGSSTFSRSCIALHGIVMVFSHVCIMGLLVVPPAFFFIRFAPYSGIYIPQRDSSSTLSS